jgi:serine/threonine protein kinase
LAGAAPVIVPGFISAVNNAQSLHALCQPDRRKSIPGKLSTQTAAAALIRASPLDDAARLRPECIWVGVATVINRAASVDSPRSSAAWSVPSTTGGDTAARRLMSRSVSSSTSRSGGLSKPKRLRALQLGPLVGVGSYGKVYRGMLGMKEVAVKVLDLSEITGRTEQAEKVLQEAALSRHLAHPNIVPTFDFVIVDEDSDRRGSMDQRSSIDSAASGYTTAPSTYAMNVSLTPRSVWIVQHYCDRGCLYDAIDIGCLRQERARHSPPSLPAVLATALDVASGMEYLHEEGVVHGDLSGNNVLLTASKTDPRGFTAMVSDFGLSRPHQGALSTKTVGTVSFKSLFAIFRTCWD